jgi:hypothetical protein
VAPHAPCIIFIIDRYRSLIVVAKCCGYSFVLLILHSFLSDRVTSVSDISNVALCSLLMLTSDCAYVEKHV